MKLNALLWTFIILLSKLKLNEAIVCYKCDSLSLDSCAMLPLAANDTELPFEQCSGLECVMAVVDSITYRGCANQTPTIGATYSKRCSTNLCNKGVYPPGRLKCHHCHGEACNEQQTRKPVACLYHHEYDECYMDFVQADNQVQVYRGCKSDSNHTLSSKAILCDVNGCNNAAGSRPLQCAQCDSQINRGCKMDLFLASDAKCNITQYQTCQVQSLITKEGYCFTYQHLDRVVRGCSNDMPDELKGEVDKIQSCDDNDLCNSKCLKQRQCLQCDSLSNATCRGNATEVRPSVCGSAEVSSCYACEYEDLQVRRNCGPPPTEPGQIHRCYECDDTAPGCNAKAFTRCYKCSTEDDPSCASWDRPGYVDIEECPQADGQCITATFMDGRTLRGCESDWLWCNDTLAACHNCTGSFCNRGASAELQQLRCYQCSGIGDPACDSVNTKDPLPCLRKSTDPLDMREACIEFFDAEQQIMLRGCLSNSPLYYKCLLQHITDDASSMESCHVCYDNGCNDRPGLLDPLLNCYQCDGSLDCDLNQEVFKHSPKPCIKKVPFGAKESCYITRRLDGSTTRGCTLDSDSQTLLTIPWETTSYCYSNACNSLATSVRHTLARSSANENSSNFYLISILFLIKLQYTLP